VSVLIKCKHKLKEICLLLMFCMSKSY
jgi:hypothetical protein